MAKDKTKITEEGKTLDAEMIETYSEFETVKIEITEEGKHKLTVGEIMEVSGNVANVLIYKGLAKAV